MITVGRTEPECRHELQGALESWIWLGLRLGHTLPVVDGIDLNLHGFPATWF